MRGSAIFVELRLVTDGRTDRQTDGQTHDDSIYRDQTYETREWKGLIQRV